MAQRDILENGINLLKQLRGPAKILTAPATLPMPVRIEQVIDPTGGAAASGWTTIGSTRGGINVTKTINQETYEDIDQILGPYDQRIVSRAYRIATQLAEVQDYNQLAIAYELGTATQVSTGGATQFMLTLDPESNVPVERRVAVIHPKGQTGKVFGIVFRRVALAGGDKVLRFDKNDPVSPALEFVTFPEIATTIPPAESNGRVFDIA